MDIKTRIDALTEAEAKAALLWVLKRDAIITKISCEVSMESARFERSIVSYENEILGEALKEGAEMSEDAKYTCDFCGSKTGGDDGFIYCPYCGEPYDAEGYEPSRPLPCVRDEHGEINGQTVKQHLQKINEELDELKEAVYKNRFYRSIAEEAADVKTAVTTLEEALGIDAEMRDEAQRRVNEKNRERGRL